MTRLTRPSTNPLSLFSWIARTRAPTVANRLVGRPSSPAALLRVDSRSDDEAELIRFGDRGI